MIYICTHLPVHAPVFDSLFFFLSCDASPTSFLFLRGSPTLLLVTTSIFSFHSSQQSKCRERIISRWADLGSPSVTPEAGQVGASAPSATDGCAAAVRPSSEAEVAAAAAGVGGAGVGGAVAGRGRRTRAYDHRSSP